MYILNNGRCIKPDFSQQYVKFEKRVDFEGVYSYNIR